MPSLLLTMCIRAIDYTPPIHITFGHYLSAMLTADLEVRSDDSRYNLRNNLRDVMKQFGITAASRGSDGYWLPPTPAEKLARGGAHLTALQTDDTEMFRHIWNNRRRLHLNPHAFTQHRQRAAVCAGVAQRWIPGSRDGGRMRTVSQDQCGRAARVRARCANRSCRLRLR